MKAIYLTVLELLATIPAINFSDRDRGQIDRYTDRPAVQFPCALIKVNFPKRKNLDSRTQMITASIVVRVAFERLSDASSISTEQRRNSALAYYDAVESIENVFQGFADSRLSPLECTSTIDEERPDLDVVRFTFSTNLVKEVGGL